MLRPPVAVRPSSTPISEPIKRESITTAGLDFGAKYQRPMINKRTVCNVVDVAQLLKFSGVNQDARPPRTPPSRRHRRSESAAWRRE